MTNIIEYHRLQNYDLTRNRLLIYMECIDEMANIKSISKELSELLLACGKNRRSLKLENLFNSVLDELPDGIIIKDIDVVFNPEYKVDVLKILIEARKRKKYSLIWPGRYTNGKLIYGEEGFLDYKTYDIENYDITCVIGGYDK